MMFLVDLAALEIVTKATRGQLGLDLRWYVCRNCLWTTANYASWVDRVHCTRPDGTMFFYGGSAISPASGFALCGSGPLVPFPDELDAALWSALLTGGPNAVIFLIQSLSPADVGLPTTREKWKERKARR